MVITDRRDQRLDRHISHFDSGATPTDHNVAKHWIIDAVISPSFNYCLTDQSGVSDDPLT